MKVILGTLTAIVVAAGALAVLAVVVAFTTRTVTFPGKLAVHLTLEPAPEALYGELPEHVFRAEPGGAFVLPGRLMNETTSLLDLGKPAPRRVMVRFYEQPGRTRPHELVFVLQGLTAAAPVPPRPDSAIRSPRVQRTRLDAEPYGGELWVSARWSPRE